MFFGFTGEAEKLARSYAAFMSRSGRSRAEISSDFKAYRDEHGDRPLELEPLVRWAEQRFGPEVVRHQAAWFDTIDAEGVGAIEPMPPPTPERLAEVEKLMRDDPRAYHADPWAAQDQMDYLLPPSDPVAKAAVDEVLGESQSAGRMREIESLMRSDPAAYWGNRAMRVEYEKLVDTSMQKFEIGQPIGESSNGREAEGAADAAAGDTEAS